MDVLISLQDPMFAKKDVDDSTLPIGEEKFVVPTSFNTFKDGSEVVVVNDQFANNSNQYGSSPA